MTSSLDEFDWIATLRTQTTAAESLGLLDDAAIIPGRAGHDLIISKDMIVEGVHFLSGSSPRHLARKALAVSLSDLAAKGAEPYGYFLGVAWPPEVSAEEQELFAAGLVDAEAEFAVGMFGGDTVTSPGPLMISVTVLGWVEEGQMVRRDDAVADTFLMVSGTIGDGWLGLLAARGELPGLSEMDRASLAAAYERPVPRLGANLARADACADISDGLVADAGHIASASGVAMEIDLEAVPLSDEARIWLDQQDDRRSGLISLVTGGDDYELVATGPAPLPGFTVIGRVVQGAGVAVLYENRPVTISRPGWRHGKEE